MLAMSSINSISVIISLQKTKPMPSRLDYRFFNFCATCNLKFSNKKRLWNIKDSDSLITWPSVNLLNLYWFHVKIAVFKPIHFSAGAINPIANRRIFWRMSHFVRDLSYEYGQMLFISKQIRLIWNIEDKH